MSRRYNPKRDEPTTWAELLSWLCVRLARGERAVSERWQVLRDVDATTGEDMWTVTGNSRSRLPLHKAEVADEHDSHATRVEQLEARRAERRA